MIRGALFRAVRIPLVDDQGKLPMVSEMAERRREPARTPWRTRRDTIPAADVPPLNRSKSQGSGV